MKDTDYQRLVNDKNLMVRTVTSDGYPAIIIKSGNSYYDVYVFDRDESVLYGNYRPVLSEAVVLIEQWNKNSHELSELIGSNLALNKLTQSGKVYLDRFFDVEEPNNYRGLSLIGKTVLFKENDGWTIAQIESYCPICGFEVSPIEFTSSIGNAEVRKVSTDLYMLSLLFQHEFYTGNINPVKRSVEMKSPIRHKDWKNCFTRGLVDTGEPVEMKMYDTYEFGFIV